MTGVQAAVLGGSALILVILLLRLSLKNHLPRSIFPALWCAAAIRLLPIEIPTRLSVWNLLRVSAAAQPGGGIAETLLPFPALPAQAAPAAAAGIDWTLVVWLGPTAVLGVYFALGYLLMVQQFRGVRMTPQPSIDALLNRFRFSRDPRICATKNRRAPLTFGVFCPTVLLPADVQAGSAQFQLILAHELAHVRRKDCLRKLLLTACLCIYWWNPLVWLMVWLANRDMELACDETVLCMLGPECKKAYALTLLDMAQRHTGSAPLSSGFARSSAEERVRAILRFRHIPAWAGAAAAVLFLLAASVFATQAQSAVRSPEAPASVQESVQTQPVIRVEPTVTPAPAQASEPDSAQPAAPAYIWPLEDADAAVTDTYGWQTHTLTQQRAFHSGVDLAAAAGQNVLAVAGGTVLDCSYDEVYGYHVTLAHENGVQTLYAHLSHFYVETGDTVAQGQVIAAAGATGWATGPHLHLGVFQDGEAVDPLAALASGPE